MKRKITRLALTIVVFFAVTAGLLQYVREVNHLLGMARSELLIIARTTVLTLGEDVAERVAGELPIDPVVTRLKRSQDLYGSEEQLYLIVFESAGARIAIHPSRESLEGQSFVKSFDLDRVRNGGTVTLTGARGLQGKSSNFAFAPVFDPKGKTIGALVVESEASRLYRVLSLDALLLACVLLLGVSFTLLMSHRLVRNVVRPLTELIDAVDAAGDGDYSHPLPLQAEDEIGHLARRFDRMRKLTQKARQDERLAAVGQMVGSLVHDLRNPVTVVTGMADLIAIEEDPVERREMTDSIRRSADRMSALCNDVLDFTRGSSQLQIAEYDPVALVKEIFTDLSAVAELHEVECHIERQVDVVISGDREKIRRVIENLVKNGIEASEPGGRLDVSLARSGDSLEFAIRDRGNGIPSEIAEHLFEPFITQGKKNGTGLGLAIVKSIVEAHGGEIEFETEAGKGTTFRVQLPLVTLSDSDVEA